jgi:DNA-binding NarL/FixJ family response regulator
LPDSSDYSSSVNTLVICDPEPIAMEGLRSLLESTGDARVVATETSLDDAVVALIDFQPDLLLVDKRFGASALANLMRQSDIGSAVIVWGTGMTEPEALDLLHSGVAGVVSKTASLRDLLDCVNSVASGRKWIDTFDRAKYVH